MHEHEDVVAHLPGRSAPRLHTGSTQSPGCARCRRPSSRGGQPEMTHHDVQARPGHGPGVVDGEDIRGHEQVLGPGDADHLHLQGVAHPRLPDVGPEAAIDKPTRRTSSRNTSGSYERVGAVHPGKHRGVVDHGEHLSGHLHHDVVGVAVGQQAGQGAATGHPVPPAGVVDDEEVDPADLPALGRQAGAGAAADDRLTPGTITAAVLRAHHSQLEADAANAGRRARVPSLSCFSWSAV